MNIKQLLLKQTYEAYAGEPDMSLMAALADLAPGEAAWRLNETTWTIEENLYHVAACKLDYCQQGFGQGHEDYAKPLGDLAAMLALLDHAHQQLMQCLERCSVADLEKPIPLQYHGQSAAHFFWIMIMHDINHASAIGMIRRAYGSRTDFYPI